MENIYIPCWFSHSWMSTLRHDPSSFLKDPVSPEKGCCRCFFILCQTTDLRLCPRTYFSIKDCLASGYSPPVSHRFRLRVYPSLLCLSAAPTIGFRAYLPSIPRHTLSLSSADIRCPHRAKCDSISRAVYDLHPPNVSLMPSVDLSFQPTSHSNQLRLLARAVSTTPTVLAFPPESRPLLPPVVLCIPPSPCSSAASTPSAPGNMASFATYPPHVHRQTPTVSPHNRRNAPPATPSGIAIDPCFSAPSPTSSTLSPTRLHSKIAHLPLQQRPPVVSLLSSSRARPHPPRIVAQANHPLASHFSQTSTLTYGNKGCPLASTANGNEFPNMNAVTGVPASVQLYPQYASHRSALPIGRLPWVQR